MRRSLLVDRCRFGNRPCFFLFPHRSQFHLQIGDLDDERRHALNQRIACDL